MIDAEQPSDLSHLYIHVASAGDLDACDAARADVRTLVKSLDERDAIGGYRLALIRDEESAENEMLDMMGFDYGEVTKHRFPFVYVLVTPHTPDSVGIDDVMQARGFQRFA